MSNKLLATFVAKEINEKFDIYGKYEIEVGKEFDFFSEVPKLIEFKYPTFLDVTAKIYKGNIKEDYSPKGESWAGQKYDASDMMEFFIAALIRGDKTYEKIYLNEDIENLINSYMSEEEIAITINNKNIYKRILPKNMYSLYQLMLVTNEFIYYGQEDSVIMLDINTRTIVSDNYFAEVGYFDSVENIKSGKETLLWGKLPDETN
jgi:hypothetical protein